MSCRMRLLSRLLRLGPLYASHARLAMATMATMASPAASSSNPTGGPSQQPQNLKRHTGNHPKDGPWKKKKRTKREKLIKEGSSEEVLQADIRALLASRTASPQPDEDGPSFQTAIPGSPPPLPAEGSEIEVHVAELSSTGDGLALRDGSNQVYVVPFVVPGDVARVKVFRHVPTESHSVADLISIVKPSPLRDDARIKCKYFSRCSGCQFQMLDYAEQLRLKRTIVEKAYRNFSQLAPEVVPPVLDTIGSPLQYGYRTKLTPHFDGPPGALRKRGPRPAFSSCPDVGFMQKGRRRVLDIEDCPIGTDAVRQGMQRERERMHSEYASYTRGATILLRESTRRVGRDSKDVPESTPSDAVRAETERHVEIKTCTSDNNAMTSDYVDDYLFTNPAGSFFQNNSSILSPFTAYIRNHILPTADTASPSDKKIRHLIDAYSGSGLFTITLSPLFESSLGIDVADNSIKCARENARLNNLPESRCRFVAADAAHLFRSVDFDPDETAVVLDPPRKGCDADFLAQLLRFAPKRIVYVSCNVHTQARDIGVLVRGEGGEGAGYDIESLRGFDFFPQTGHVEGVAVLNRAV